MITLAASVFPSTVIVWQLGLGTMTAKIIAHLMLGPFIYLKGPERPGT